jgi:diguanylate cyclase (GGDEF)-like protein
VAARLRDVERRAAYLAAYEVFENAQGEDHASAVARLPVMAAEAEHRSWHEVSFVLAAAQTVHAMTRPEDECDPAPLVRALLRRAEALDAPAFVAMATGFRAIVASTTGDAANLLADVGRAVALLDDTEQPPLDRCTGYVVVAAALNTLQLWELVDEMYTRAAELSPECEAPAQAAAVAVNRVLIRLEWACALLEDGDERASREQLQRAEAAVPAALAERLPALWRRDVEACSDILRLLRGADPIPMEAALAEHRKQLSAGNDLEVLPLLNAAWALALVQDGHLPAAVAAAKDLAPTSSSSSGARSFPLWVRAQVLAAEAPSVATSAQRDHAVLVGRLRRESRLAVLGAAHAQIAVERRRAEHERLAHQVNTDALTGLSNRRSFDAWQQAPGPVRRATALLLVDLDGFKAVNDTYGHGCGDEVLRRVGRLISASIRSGDLALRLGGDEFAVLLEEDLLSETAVVGRAEALRSAVAGEPWSDVADGLVITASIGVAVADPADTVGSGSQPTAESIYRSADTALYTAKRRRTGIVVSTGAPADRAQNS